MEKNGGCFATRQSTLAEMSLDDDHDKENRQE
jgi:hypothetical protein